MLPPCSFWLRLSGSPGACRWCAFCLAPVLRLVVFGFLLRSCAVLAPGFCVVLSCVPGFRLRVQSRTGAVPRTEHCWQVYKGMQTLWQVWYWVFLIFLRPYSTLEMMRYCMLWPYFGLLDSLLSPFGSLSPLSSCLHRPSSHLGTPSSPEGNYPDVVHTSHSFVAR